MFRMGAFGQPQSLDALLLYWTKLELLHYPGAADTKEYLLKAKEKQTVLDAVDARAREDARRTAEAQAQRLSTAGRGGWDIRRGTAEKSRKPTRKE